MQHNLTNGSLVTTFTQDQIITVILIGLLILTLLVLNIVFYLTYRNVVNDYNLQRNLNISAIFMNQIKPLIGTVVRSQRQGTLRSVPRVNSESSVSRANSERSEADTLPKKIVIEEDFIDNQESTQSVKPKMNHFYSKQSFQRGEETTATTNKSNRNPNLRGSQDMDARSSPKQSFQCSEETKATSNRSNPNPSFRCDEDKYVRSSPKTSVSKTESPHPDKNNTKHVEAISPKRNPSKSHLTSNSVDAIARSSVFKLEPGDNIPQSRVTNLEHLQSATLQSVKSQSLSILNIRNMNQVKNVHFDKDTKIEAAMIRSASANDGFVAKERLGGKTHTRVFHNDQATKPVPMSFVKPGTKTPGNSADSIRLSTMTVTPGSTTVQVTDLSQTNLKEKSVNVCTINKSEAQQGQNSEKTCHHRKFNAKGDNHQARKYPISQMKQCDQNPLQKLKIHSPSMNPVTCSVDKSKNISLTRPMPCSSDVPISSQSRLVMHSEKDANQCHVRIPSSESSKTALLMSESEYTSDKEKRKSLTSPVVYSSERVNSPSLTQPVVFSSARVNSPSLTRPVVYSSARVNSPSLTRPVNSSTKRFNNPSLTRPGKFSQPSISQIARCSNSSIKITDDSVGDKRVCERNVSTDTINSLEVAILASEEDNYGEIEIVDNSSLARLKRPRSIHDDYPVVEFQNLAFDISEMKTDASVGDIEL